MSTTYSAGASGLSGQDKPPQTASDGDVRQQLLMKFPGVVIRPDEPTFVYDPELPVGQRLVRVG